MNILITGVAGFIGSNLADRLITDGHWVFGIDDLSHGSMDNIQHLIGNERFSYTRIRVQDFHPHMGCDVIVHLASEKIPRYYNALSTIVSNHEMTCSVINWAKAHGSHLIFASTSDIYGLNETVPFGEDAPLVMGRTDVKRWAYAVSKMHSEHHIIASRDALGVPYTVLRFFSCYGPRQAPGWWGGAQSAFIDNVMAGKEIEIHGNGMQSRCFTYIDDVVEGVVLAIINPGVRDQIFNVGNPSSHVTVYGLSKLLFSFMNKAVPIKYIPYSDLGKYEDPKIKLPDITKAKQILGFEPKWSLYDGLRRTIEWKLNQQRDEK